MIGCDIVPEVIVKAPCKINLALDIINRRPDGMHTMDMVMQTVSLYDIITVQTCAESGICLTCDAKGVPNDRSNIAWKCAEGFLEFVGMDNMKTDGINIHIQKNIPIMAGLGGGSADGAGVLVALNQSLSSSLPLWKLCEIGEHFGADIPFCVIGGTARTTGIGQIIETIPNIPDCYILIAKPYCSVSTKKAFEAFDKRNKQNTESGVDGVVHGIRTNDLSLIASSMYNAFENLDTNVMNEVLPIKKVMLEDGAIGAVMSGSGSAVFGIFKDCRNAQTCMKKLESISEERFLVRPVSQGPEII